PLLLQLGVASPGVFQLGRQGVEPGLQRLPFPAEWTCAFILQLEPCQPGLGLQLLQTVHLRTSLVELPLQLAELLLPLLLALTRLLQLFAGGKTQPLLIGEQLLTLFESRRLLLPLERAFGQLFLLARELRPDAHHPVANRVAPDLPVAPKLGLMQLRLFEAGDALATEKNLLLAARLLGLSLLAGLRQ